MQGQSRMQGRGRGDDATGYRCPWAGWILQVERSELRFWRPLLHPCRQRQVGARRELVAQD